MNDSSIPVFNPVPKMYDEISGEIYFEPYAIEAAARVKALHPGTVLETAHPHTVVEELVHLGHGSPDARLRVTGEHPREERGRPGAVGQGCA